MLFYLKAGWVRWTIGTVLLLAAFFGAGALRGNVLPETGFTTRPEPGMAIALRWIVVGILADLLAPAAALAVGSVLLPRHFLGWAFKPSARLFGKASWPLAACCGVTAGLLEEPLLRMHLQPEIFRLMGEEAGALVLLAAVVGLYWTPLSNSLGLWSAPRFLILTYFLEKGGGLPVAMVVHGVGDFLWIALWGQLGRLGMTHEPTSARPLPSRNDR